MKLALAFENWIMSNMGGVARWIGSLTGTQAAWLGVGITLALWTGYVAIAYWWNNRPDPSEAFDSEWMDWQAWRETR